LNSLAAAENSTGPNLAEGAFHPNHELVQDGRERAGRELMEARRDASEAQVR
jgi:hypothetical protein